MREELATSRTSGASENRKRAWRRARELSKPSCCPWTLERFKSTFAQSDDDLVSLPEDSTSHSSMVAGLRGVIACLVGIGLWMLYVARHRAGIGQPGLRHDASRVIALHAETTTRTRHVLQAMSSSDVPVAGVILLGRVRNCPRTMIDVWAIDAGEAVLTGLPVVLPISPRACMRAFADLPRHMARGITASARTSTPISFRDEVAIVFRIILGLTATRWWERYGTGLEVLFGHTGTADTTLLEGAMRRGGARTIHLVHGQATGPNFLGFSDVALFRSRHDADAYGALGCYGQCETQPAARPDPQRGTSGLLLLSNLAHPMNVGFRSTGLNDELELLSLVADAARSLGPIATPLLWKPHPAISALPIETQIQLRSAAQKLGFAELDADSRLETVAASSHWVVSSPSTVALDLLQAGVVCVMLDLQGTLLDTAVHCLPSAPRNGPELTAILSSISRPEEYSSRFLAAWEAIGPARVLDLGSTI